MTVPYWLQVAATPLLVVWTFAFFLPHVLRRFGRQNAPSFLTSSWPGRWFIAVETWTCPKCGVSRREEHRSVFIGELGLTAQDTTPELRPCPGCGYVRVIATLAVCRTCGAEHAEAAFLTMDEHGIRLPVMRCPTCMHPPSPPVGR